MKFNWRKLKYVILSTFIVVAGVAVYGQLNNSKITIILSEKVNPTKTIVKVGNVKAALSKDGSEYVYSAVVRSGKHDVEIESEGYSPISQTLDVGFRKNIEFNAKLIKTTQEEPDKTARVVYDDKDADIRNGKYFGNGSWLVFSATTIGSNEDDGATVVAKKVGTDWEIVEEGSDIDTSAAVFNDAPIELLNYLRDGSR
jgi:hypothetical protein